MEHGLFHLNNQIFCPIYIQLFVYHSANKMQFKYFSIYFSIILIKRNWSLKPIKQFHWSRSFFVLRSWTYDMHKMKWNKDVRATKETKKWDFQFVQCLTNKSTLLQRPSCDDQISWFHAQQKKKKTPNENLSWHWKPSTINCIGQLFLQFGKLSLRQNHLHCRICFVHERRTEMNHCMHRA